MKIPRLLLAVLLLLAAIPPAFADVALQAKVLLQGAYDAPSGLMRDDLRRKGYLPGAGDPLTYTGEEVASEGVLVVTGENAVVDWVTLELHDATDSTLLYASRGLLVQRNGQVIVPNGGAKDIMFKGVAPGNYRVSIRHRNHLAVMTEGALALSANPQLLDFSDPALAVQGGALSRYVSANKAMLWAGDADANARIIANGPNTDLNTLLGYVLTEPANTHQDTNFRLNGYVNTDLNLDGVTIYTDPATDANLLIGNVLLHPNNQTASLNYVVGIPKEEMVTPLVNVARQYGVATQSTTISGNDSAAQAIDGDWGTISDTNDVAGDHWWQLKLPTTTNIASIVIRSDSHPLFYNWMAGITVYVSDSPYSDALSDADKVATLSGVFANTITLNPARSGTYVIVKGNYLRLAEVEVYAQVPDAPVAIDAVTVALRTGTVTAVTGTALLDATLDTITANQNLLLDAKTKLFNLNADGTAKTDGSSLTALDWNPTHDASTLLSTYGLNTGVLNTNAVYTDGYTVYAKEIGIIGASPARYLVLGGNPLRSGNVINAQMQQFMENSFAWLTQRGDLKTAAFKVVIAHLDESYYFKDESSVRTWLDTHYPGKVSYNAANSCDDDKLASCLAAKPDVLIISQVANTGSDAVAIAASVQAAMQQGIPVLYLHHDGGLTALGEKLFPLFNVTYQWDNYWKKLGLKKFDVTGTLSQLPDNIRAIQTLLQHFKAQDYAFDWSVCADGNCDAVVGWQEQFRQGAEAVRSMMNDFDVRKQNLFAQEGFRLQKLLALLGDAYRQQVRFPMDKTTTNSTAFLQSLFADHAVYNYRAINPAQPDMGNFSRSDFSHVTPATKTVTLTSRQYFRAAGVYALPGQTFRVTRNDSSPTTTKVFVNTLRAGSTHEFEAGGYKRPKYLQSAHIPLQSGETIAITSPYGGPIQLEFSANDQPVSFTFEQVGEHPFWDDAGDNASFTAKLAQGDYDWAEFITPAFEIHSTLDKMRTSASDTRWGGTLEGFAAATMRYTHNFPHVLAGFKGPGIDVVPEIHDFAAANGYDIDNLDLVKHMNADQATCGAGCSGNPYDAYWSFEPIGHGDIHELGHGLEKGRFRFSGWNYHASTNPYAYYSKTQYYKTTGGEPECQSLPFKEAFDALQASVGQADAATYLKANYWDAVVDNWSRGVSMTIQMMMLAEDQGKLQSGWHLLARLHILEREFNRAKASDATWESKKASLGFASYSRAEAEAISNDDWMLIAVSQATGLDYRDYLRMWGITVSSKAAEQVAGRGFAAAPRAFFISSPAGYCKGEGFDGNKLPVDGAQVWTLAAKKSRLIGDSFR